MTVGITIASAMLKFEFLLENDEKEITDEGAAVKLPSAECDENITEGDTTEEKLLSCEMDISSTTDAFTDTVCGTA